MDLELEKAKKKLTKWYDDRGVGCLRFAFNSYGGLSAGQERVFKADELPKEIQEAALAICEFCQSPRIELISVDHEFDRLVLYRTL